MKTVTVWATWCLEHLLPGGDGETLAGDLLEELQGGRSAGWYRRELVAAAGVGIARVGRWYAGPVAFSVGWCLLFPAWQHLLLRVLPGSLPQRWVAMDWPLSACLALASSLLPALAFIWAGALLFVALRQQRSEAVISRWRVLGAISLSVNVLLLATMGISAQFGSAESGLHPLPEALPFALHPLLMQVPVGLSLLSALLVACAGRRPGCRSALARAGR